MSKIKLKEGDIVRPIKGKKTSNDKTLVDLKELEIIKIYGDFKKSDVDVEVKIIKGSSKCKYWLKHYKEGQILTLFLDCLELSKPKQMFKF